MAWTSILRTVFLLAYLSSIHGQYFDFFQALQPYIQTQPNQQFSFYNDISTRRPKPKQKPSNTDTRNSSIRKVTASNAERRRKPTTEAPFDINFFTTQKAVRKTTKAPANTPKPQSKDTLTRPIANSKVTNDFSNPRDAGAIYFEDDSGTRPLASGSKLDSISSHRAPVNANRPKMTTVLPTKKNQPLIAHDSVTYNNDNSVNYFTTKAPFYETTKLYQQNRDNKMYYTTHNPVSSRPGVRPLVVNGPPITNRPVTVSDVGHDASPEIVTGPDEDYMTAVEKKRYIDIAERMCEKYKSLNIKKVQAIPLVPSPHAVEVNVTSCAPKNVPLIVGGRVAKIEEFPHMALLGWKKVKNKGYSWKCGGTLVSNLYILTAGHCAFQDRDDNVIAGPPRMVQLGSSFLDDQRATLVRIASVIRHPKYKQPKAYYDLAIVKMVSAVSFSDTIKPACLGVPPRPGQPIIATGWGKTEFGGTQSRELRSVSVPVWTLTDCYNALGVSTKIPNGPSGDSQICAGSGGKDTCQGDSGGPAQIQDGCMWRVVAITSVGRACGSAETPAIYATIQRPFVSAVVFGNEPTNSNRNQESGQRNAFGDQTISIGGESNNPRTDNWNTNKSPQASSGNGNYNGRDQGTDSWNTNKNNQATTHRTDDNSRGQTVDNNKRSDNWNTNKNIQQGSSHRTDDSTSRGTNNNPRTERTDTWNYNKNNQKTTSTQRNDGYNRDQTNNNPRSVTSNNNKNIQQTTSTQRNDGNNRDQTNNNPRSVTSNNNKNIQQTTSTQRNDGYNRGQTNNNPRSDTWNNNQQTSTVRNDNYNSRDQTINNNQQTGSWNSNKNNQQTRNNQRNDYNSDTFNNHRNVGNTRNPTNFQNWNRQPNNQGNYNNQRDTNYYNYNTQTGQYNDPNIQNGFYSPREDYFNNYSNNRRDPYRDRESYYAGGNVWWT